MVGIKERAIYISIFLAIICVSVSIKSTEKKDAEPFEKKLVFIRFIIEETGEKTDQFPLDRPLSFSQDSKGNIYILDSGNHCVVKYSPEGKYIKHWGKKGQGPGEFLLGGSADLVYVANNDIVYTMETRASRIQLFDTDGKIISSFMTERIPESICVDSKGNIFVSHALGSDNDSLIYVYDFRGKKIRQFGTPVIKTQNYWFNGSFLTRDNEDNIYQVFKDLPILRKYSNAGKISFEKRVDFRRCKSIKKYAEFWYNFKLNESEEVIKSFTRGIFYRDNSLYIHHFHTIVLSKDGDVIGVYLYDSKLGDLLLPQSVIADILSKEFFVLFWEKDRNGVALFER